MTERDYAQEMHTFIESKLDVDSYTSAAVAIDIVDELREHDPDLLRGWLNLRAVRIVREEVNRIGQSTRARARISNKRAAFQVHRSAIENGEKVDRWLDAPFEINAEHRKTRLALMTAEELDFAVERYRQRAAENSFEARFLAAVRERVPEDATVQECLTEEEIVELREKVNDSDDEDE